MALPRVLPDWECHGAWRSHSRSRDHWPGGLESAGPPASPRPWVSHQCPEHWPAECRHRPDSPAARGRLCPGPGEYCFLIYPGGLAHGGMPMYERLLVAVDHSEVSDRVIAAARDIASLSKGKVWVLHLQEREWGRVGRTPCGTCQPE